MGRTKERNDPLMDVADKMRSKKGVPYASGKLEVNGEGTWVEYVRGKDLAVHLREQPELMAPFVAALKPGRTLEHQVADFVELLLRRHLLMKVDRKFKKPKPGKKKLVKWPKSLELASEPGFAEDAFYAWAYDRPTSPWTHLLSALVVIFTVGCCLFPLAPHHIRIWVVYSLLGLLSLLLGTLALRYVVAGAAWIVTGGELWIFPNMTSDDVPITEAFWPIISYKKPGKQSAAHYAVRLTVLLLAGGLVYVLYAFSPGAIEIRENARRAHDSIITMLEKYNHQQLHLTNGTSAGGNGTTAEASGAAGGSTTEDLGAGAAGAGAADAAAAHSDL